MYMDKKQIEQRKQELEIKRKNAELAVETGLIEWPKYFQIIDAISAEEMNLHD